MRLFYLISLIFNALALILVLPLILGSVYFSITLLPIYLYCFNFLIAIFISFKQIYKKDEDYGLLIVFGLIGSIIITISSLSFTLVGEIAKLNMGFNNLIMEGNSGYAFVMLNSIFLYTLGLVISVISIILLILGYFKK
jgi:hypothetical protein